MLSEPIVYNKICSVLVEESRACSALVLVLVLVGESRLFFAVVQSRLVLERAPPVCALVPLCSYVLCFGTCRFPAYRMQSTRLVRYVYRFVENMARAENVQI